MAAADHSVAVLFVCLGNICRSPTAEGVFSGILQKEGASAMVRVDSCGTSHWHVGEAPDSRAIEEAARRGYDLSRLRGRQVRPADFVHFDYILAMDKANLAALRDIAPADFSGYLGLFLDFALNTEECEVPDPYYGGASGFAHVLELVESASQGLLLELKRCGGLRAGS